MYGAGMNRVLMPHQYLHRRRPEEAKQNDARLLSAQEEAENLNVARVKNLLLGKYGSDYYNDNVNFYAAEGKLPENFRIGRQLLIN